MITLYLLQLIIVPQEWIEPFIGLRSSVILYPVWLLFLIATNRYRDIVRFNVMDYMFLAMIFWILVSSYLNPWDDKGALARMEYIRYFILYRFVVATLTGDDGFIGAIKRLSLMVFIVAIQSIDHRFDPEGLGWADQPFGWVVQSVIEAGGVGRTQWIGIFDGPGVFCVMFTLILPFVLIKFDKVYSNGEKFIALLALMVLLPAIWFTGSRGGFLATLVVFGCYMMVRFRISVFKVGIAASILVVLYSLAPAHLTSVRDEKGSAQRRVDLWFAGVEIFEENPILGVGKRNFPDYAPTRLVAHNSFVENLAETGGPGIFFWMALLYLAFKSIRLYVRAEEDRRRQSFAIGVGISLIGYLASSWFVTLEYETLYFMLALCRTMVKQKDIELRFEMADFRNVALVILALIVALKFFFRIY